MIENINFEYTIFPAWEAVKTVDRKIKEIFDPHNTELIIATSMVVSELIENAVKYGEEHSVNKSINFKFSVENNHILIQVINPVYKTDKLELFKKHIDDIQNSDNPLELYTNRLRELIKDPNIKNTQLGLYRIAYEGKYKLSYTLNDNILTVVAVREIK